MFYLSASYLSAAPFVASALGLVVMLFLFASVKIELRKASQRARGRSDRIQAQIAEQGPVFIPVAPRPGLNMERRVYALHLLRRGQDAGHIAAALGIPSREVELLIRVQRL